MKHLILSALLIFAQTRQPGEIKATYDKFQDTSTVTLYYMPVPTEKFERLVMGAYFTHAGLSLKEAPPNVTLLFRSNSDGWKYLRRHQRGLILMVDDERIPLGSIERVEDEILSNGVIEYLGVVVSRSTFEKIANAKKVEAQLGRTEFHLTDGNLKYLREFLGKMNPSITR